MVVPCIFRYRQMRLKFAISPSRFHGAATSQLVPSWTLSWLRLFCFSDLRGGKVEVDDAGSAQPDGPADVDLAPQSPFPSGMIGTDAAESCQVDRFVAASVRHVVSSPSCASRARGNFWQLQCAILKRSTQLAVKISKQKETESS